jgi:hypothetical protein
MAGAMLRQSMFNQGEAGVKSMATKTEQMQRFQRYYREQVGNDVTMHEVAAAALKAGWKAPVPKDPVEILAKEFARAAREEIRYDEETGEPYRANISYNQMVGDRQQTFWGDIDQVSRRKMHNNYILRREQMVGDGLQMTLDLRHWNRVNSNDEPIHPELDFTDDVQWRLNAPKGNKDAA